MLERLRKRRPYLLALLVFWLLIRIIVNPFSSDKLDVASVSFDTTYDREDDRDATAVMFDGDCVEQPFVASIDDFCGISLRLQVDMTSLPLDGQITAEIVDKNGSIAASSSVDTSGMMNDSTMTLRFDAIPDSAQQEYTLRLRAVGLQQGTALRFLLGKTWRDAFCTDHGVALDRPVYLQTIYYRGFTKTTYCLWWALLFILSVLIAFFADGCTPRTFLMLSGLGCLFLLFNSNFPHQFDEWTHFLKATAVSWGRPFEVVQDGAVGFDIPFYKVLYRLKAIGDWADIPMAENSTFIAMPYVANVIPIGYLVPAVGLALANILHLGALAHGLLARLSIEIFYIMFCWLAVRKAEGLRPIVFTVALLPLAQRLAGMVSPDPMLISTVLLFTSICLSCRFDSRKLTRSDTALILVCMLFFCSGKYLGYAPTALLALLIPRSSYRNASHRRTVFFTGLAVILILAAAQIALLFRFPYTEDRNGATGFNAQLMYMLQHPSQTVFVFLHYVLDSLPEHLSGLHYASIHGVLSSVIEVLCLTMAVMSPNNVKIEKGRERSKLQFVFCLLFALMASLTIISLYLAFTPVGAMRIDGMQTRYFLPELALLLTGLALIAPRAESKTYEQTLVFMLMIALLCALGGDLLSAYDIIL